MGSSFDERLERELAKIEEEKKKKKKQTQKAQELLGRYSYLPTSNTVKTTAITLDDIAPVRTVTTKKDEDELRKGQEMLERYSYTPAPIKTTTTTKTTNTKNTKKEEDDSGLDFFQKGSFEDGFDWQDIPTAILGTAGDVGLGLVKGVAGIGEGIADVIGYAGAGVADLLGADEYADQVRKRASLNAIEEVTKGADKFLDQYSLLGRTSDAVMQGIGQMGAIMATGGAAAAAGLSTVGTTAVTTGLMGVSGMGSGMSEAYQGGATDWEALKHGLNTGAADAISELIFGGMGKAVKAVGFSKGLSSADDMLAKLVGSKIKNKVAKNIVEFGIKSGAEGLEEVISGFAQAVSKHSTYLSEEDFADILKDENLLEQFIVGSLTSGVMQSGIIPGTSNGSLKESIQEGRDFITGLSQNEQAVIDKVYKDRIAEAEADGTKLTNSKKNKLFDSVVEDMEKGRISTDTIEEVLGGDSYKAYKDTLDSETALKDEQKALQEEQNTLKEEYTELNKKVLTGEVQDRREEIKARQTEIETRIGEIQKSLDDPQSIAKRNLLKAQLDKDVYELTKSDKLRESYFEVVRSKEKYQADLSKYKGKEREIIKQVMDSGLADNSNQTHEFWDLMAKLSSTGDTTISLADSAQILEMVKAEHQAKGIEFDASKFEGQRIDGYISDKGIVLNAETKRALNLVVGHEITHKLEKTKNYSKLQRLLLEYAKSEYESRFNARAGQYSNKFAADEKFKSKVDMEVTGDLVGDYLFSDKDFVTHLAKDQNVFQQVWNEIKYMAKIATAGSEQAKQLEKVKREFERAWREKQKNTTDSGSKYSLENNGKSKYNKRSKYSETETLFLSWENGSSPVGEVKKFARFGKTRYYLKTENGSVELSRQQYIERSKEYAENTYRRAEHRIGTTYDYDEITQRGLPGDHNRNRNTGGDAAVFGQTIREKLPDVSGGSESSTLRNDRGNAGINQTEYNDEASEKSDASFVTFSNDYATIRNFMKDGDTSDAPAKYSLSDSDGRQLSNEQQEYFKDSVVRDENGNLKVMYHGTSNGGHTVFDTWGKSNYGLFGTGAYFTDSKTIAESYTNKGKGNNKQVYESYLNIKNPLDMDAQADPAEWAKAFDEVDFPESGTNEDFYRAVEEYYADQYMPKWEVAEIVRDSIEFGMGYDGITHIGGGRVNADGERHRVYIAFESEQIKNTDNVSPTTDPDIRYSLSTDSDGNKLSAEQSEYFKESKAVDANGNLQRVYHGTRNADFTVFKRNVNFFTDSKEMADSYSPNGAMYEGYVNITKPYEIDAAGEKWSKIPIDSDMKKFLQEYGASVFKEGGKWRTTTADIASAIEEAADNGDMDYDGIIIRNVDDTGSYYKGEGKNVATDYIVFNSNQFKNADNTKPTADKDIRFSLSEAVEETKDLMALHNLQASELVKALELGGLPMPSVAVIKAAEGHDKYGDVSLILPKGVIDPKKNKANKVYGGDAWTPTYPRIEYKVKDAVEKRIRDKYYELANKVGYDTVRPMYKYVSELENALNRAGGETALLQELYDDTRMMQVYLEDSGKGKVENIVKETVTEISPEQAELNRFIIDALGEDVISSFATPEGEKNGLHRRNFMDKHTDEIKSAYKRYFMELHGFTEADMENVLANTSRSDLLTIVRDAYRYTKDNGVTVKTETNYQATDAAIREAASEGYKTWVDGLFSGVAEKSGIRNNKDYYTPSGNPRSWDALHLANTLENVVKTMKGQDETGTGSFSPYSSFQSLAHKRYGSISEIKADSNRLGLVSEAEYEAMEDAFTKRFIAIADSIKNPAERNPFIAAEEAAELIVEAVRSQKTNAGILSYLKKYNKRVTEQTVADVVALVNDIANMPTGYFEAKPQRAVGFDEVAVFVIPRNADVKLKQELLNRGYNIAEYDPDVEGDRSKVLNQFEEYKFSLSNVGETPKQYGNWNVYSNYAPTQETIAPVAASETTTADANTATVEEMFPDNLEPVQTELNNLLQQKEALESRMLEMGNTGDFSDFEQVNTDYIAVTDRITELENEVGEAESDRIGSLDDADVPPEIEAPYTGEASEEPADPFVNRNMHDVGNRKVKAYQYENPEVKPFFTEAAYGMLDDLHSGTKGEKLYNDRVYYESGGEKGWIGIKRTTTDDIAELLDSWHYTYDQIEKGLNAIIEDDGKENNAVSKRIEFMLNDRLLNGYKGVDGRPYPPNQDYINLLEEKQINEYSEESFNRLLENGDAFAPPVEDIAPVITKEPAVSATETEQISEEDIAPTYTVEGKKGVPDGQQAFMPDEPAEQKLTRKQLHQNIVDKFKNHFKARGLDFDKVLKKAKNLSTFATVDNTPQRVMEKALGYKEGGILADLTVNEVAQNETAGTRWLNHYTDRKNGILAQISKKYHIKPGSKESAAAQMYAEGFYVDENNDIIQYGDRELAKDFPNAKVQQNIKGMARDPRIRQIYDQTLKAINASRARNAYPEIPRLDNYYLHFRAMEDTFSRLGLPFNPNDIRAKDLPTDLNGVTADLKPGQPYFASAMHRTGKRTSFDLLGGLERYLTSAKNQIFHIDDIQNLRALRNYIADTYGQANGLEGLDALSEEEAQERIEKVYDSHLSTFAKFLNEEANILAGKTALIDRGLEGIIGRRGITFLDTVNKQVGSNMVGFNISSSLTNFLPVAQTFAKTNKFDFVKAFAQTAANKVGSVFGKTDGFTESSPVVIRRKGADRFYRTAWQKAADPGYALMGLVDDISTELIARTKYNELTRKGMDSRKAHIETDKWVSRLMGDRSIGQQPQLYNSRMLGLFTKFQLEVRNQLDSQFYDTIQETKASNEQIKNGLLRNAKTAAKVTSTFAQLAIVQHLFGKAFESVAGYNPAFDIIEVIVKAFGWDDEEEDEDTVLDNIEEAFLALLGDLPYTSTLTGGRIPIESALPVEQFVTGKDQYGNEKSRWETLGEVAPYYLMPGGYGQFKKTKAGLDMFSDEHPVAGSYTDSGNLRFPVEDTTQNRVQAAIFGQYASENARYYFDNEIAPLKEKQIQEYIDTGMQIHDYWDYREGLKGLENLSEKADYINSLDIPVETKNILINNLTERKEPINMEGYGNFGSFEEFDFATKNPEKYKIAEYVGGYEDYMKFQEDMKDMKLAEKVDYVAGLNLSTPQKNVLINGETDRKEPIDLTGYENFNNFEEFEFAKNNPENYAVAKAVGGYESYKQYSSDLSDIHADKDENGDSISGSRKQKVADYINGLDADYYEKVILFKSQYTSYDDENYEIVEYLNNREDISYEEMVAILTKLDFTVSSDGRVTWD